MQSWALVAPVVPNKLGLLESMQEHIRTHFGDYVASRRRAGVSLERVYLITTPMGAFITNYTEGRNVGAAMQSFLTSDTSFDKWFISSLSELHGIDFTQPPPAFPEQILAYVEPTAERRSGLGFCAPILPGKTEGLRQMLNEAMGPRYPEMQRSRRAMGLTRDCAYLNRTPAGDVIGVYLEGDDPAESNRRWAQSKEPFDAWYRKACSEATGIDFTQPTPPIRCVHDWRE
jgi:hypothetical protein